MNTFDFTLRKKRDTGLLFSDFFKFFKLIFKHFHSIILNLILPFALIFTIGTYVGITYVRDSIINSNLEDVQVIIIVYVIAVLTLIFFALFISIFGVEYFVLLSKNKNLNFTIKDIFKNSKKNVFKHLKFTILAIVFSTLIFIPYFGIGLVINFVPILGTIIFMLLMFLFSFVVYLYYAYLFCALFLYLEERAGLIDSFKLAYPLIKKNFVHYGISAFIFNYLVSFVAMAFFIIPVIIIGIISLVSLKDWIDIDSFFDSVSGKSVVAIGTSFLFLINIITIFYTISFYFLIYQSAIEESFHEETQDAIDLIGTLKDENTL